MAQKVFLDVPISKSGGSLLIFVLMREFTKIEIVSVEVVRPRGQRSLPKARKVPLTQLIVVVCASNTRTHPPFRQNAATCTLYEAQPCAQPFSGHKEAR
jgi:hypothetical protein